MNVPADRLPPQNLEAEQSVLGSMLLDREAVNAAIELLRPEDFYEDTHQVVFKAVVQLYDRNRAVDVVTLAEELRRQGVLDRVGGITYLSTLAGSVPTSANIRHYADIVEAKAMLRELIGAGTTIIGRAYDTGEDPRSLLDSAEEMIFRIGEAKMRRPYQPIAPILAKTFERLRRLYETHSAVTGVATGFFDLDDITSGLQPSDLVILAGRPSQGKTAFAVNIAHRVACSREGPRPVGMFSLEMSGEQLGLRFLAYHGGFDAHRLRSGSLSEPEINKLTVAVDRLSGAPIYIDDSPNLSVLELRTRARRMKRDNDIGLLIVDYLQLMRGNWRVENRQQEIAEISRALKALARELEIPILALSQLSRAVEQRPDRRPQLSDLRESGAIEQDADLVSFIHVPSEEAVCKDWLGREISLELQKDDKGFTMRAWLVVKRDGKILNRYELENYAREDAKLTELIIAKQRNGPTGSLFMTFRRRMGTFQDLELIRIPPPARGETA